MSYYLSVVVGKAGTGIAVPMMMTKDSCGGAVGNAEMSHCIARRSTNLHYTGERSVDNWEQSAATFMNDGCAKERPGNCLRDA